MSDPRQYSIYRLRLVVNGVSPMVWRRFLVSSKTNLADLGLPVAMEHNPELGIMFQIRSTLKSRVPLANRLWERI